MSLLQRVERAQRSLAQREAERLAAEAAAAAAQAAGTVTASGQAAPAQASGQIAPGQTVLGQALPGSGAATAVPVSPGALVPVMAPATTETPPADASSPSAATSAPAQPRTAAREALMLEIRHRLVAEVIAAFDTLLDDKATDVRSKIEAIVDRTVAVNGFAVTRDERVRLVDELTNDVTGFGPLEPLLSDETITEVMVNGPTHVYIERAGKIERIESSFLNN